MSDSDDISDSESDDGGGGGGGAPAPADEGGFSIFTSKTLKDHVRERCPLCPPPPRHRLAKRRLATR